jgi:hypothetical protein
MSIIAGLVGSLSAGAAPKSAALTSTTFEPLNEGQQQTIGVNFYNWDNSPAYWTVTNSGGYPMAGQVDQDSGTINPGPGNTYYSFNFTFASDATTEGPVTYYIRLGSTVHGNEYFNEGPKTVRDSSQTPGLILDVDPASLTTPMFGLNGWADASGSSNNLSIANGSKSANNGGTLVFNGTSTYAGDLMNANLNSSVFGTITLSAWIKPTVVGSGINQTIIAKELCYKLRIDTSGEVQLYTGQGYYDASWTPLTTNAGLVTAGAWAHVVATVDAGHKRVYINGVKVAETTGVVIGANTNPFDIGAFSDNNNNTQNDFFGGLMGEIKVWNYALTGGAIRTEYNATAARYGRSTIPVPLSLGFNGTDNHYVRIADNTSDWNLGSSWTVEWWEKVPDAGTTSYRSVLCQDANVPPYLGFDIYHNNNRILMYNSNVSTWTQPTPGQWNHVALQNSGGAVVAYFNGVAVDVTHVVYYDGALTNGSLDLIVGSRTYDGGSGFYGQYFKGKLADIRISNIPRYTLNFTPPTSLVVDSNVKLALSGELTDLSSRNHTITNNGATQDTDFPY